MSRLAEDLGVAPGTVARAYRELEASGIIETRGRNGTFVAFDADPRTSAAAARCRRLRRAGARSASGAEEALAAVTAALRAAPPAPA
ncbi:GntR family transcriptional regulator [Microbacterium sp. LWH3-1.2]